MQKRWRLRFPALHQASAASYRYQNSLAPTDIATLMVSTNLSGYFYELQFVDLDGDGINEIVVAPGRKN